ncbi:MAG: rod shape-determining protein MreC [Kiritimatiellae bacterium]|nr:rod shape-determining protein MreC [Kiritimatiellia bacterium]
MDGKKKTFSIFAAVAAVVAGLSFCISRSVAVEAAYPWERGVSLLHRRVFRPVAAMFRASALSVENERLRREVEELCAVREENQSLFAENARLRKTLGYAAKSPRRYLAAEVISSGGGAAGFRQTARIGKGFLDGVKNGATVLSGGALAGQVRSTTPHTAEVAFLSDDSVKVGCETESQEPCFGILSGGSGGRLVLKHVSGNGVPPPRTRVYSSGRGGVFPAKCFVGWLLYTDTLADGVSREGYVEPAVDFDGIEDVLVVCGED